MVSWGPRVASRILLFTVWFAATCVGLAYAHNSKRYLLLGAAFLVFGTVAALFVVLQ